MDKYQLFERLFLPLCNIQYRSKRFERITVGNIFEEKQLSELSPYTGMDRDQWMASAEYLLNGIFKYVKRIEDPLFFPKQEGISYPKIIRGAKQVAYLEGLCRTLFIAAPILNEKSDLVVNNIPVVQYYRNQLTSLVDPASAVFIPDRGVDYPSQPLVEFGSLAMIFLLCREILWEPLPQDTKDKLATKMLSYGEGPYVDNNWKYFCVFILSFFKSEGYSVNENRLETLLEKIEEDYSGDGWYLDDSYDYYSMWGYQLYAAIWCNTYGQKHHPEIAARLKKNFKEMLRFYPYLFSQDGKMLMWGRSITYRFGAVAPFLFSLWVDEPDLNYGWFRRISSGTLQQFVANPDFLKQSIPVLGFYGSFEPCIQSYSCRASSFWLGKAYLGLISPQNKSFWEHPENEGPWGQYENNKSYSYYSDASNILVTQYAGIGETEIRTATPRNLDKASVYMRNENYNRLAYHTAFPWQADTDGGCVAMNYLIKATANTWEPLREYKHVSYEDGILRRRVKLKVYSDTFIDLVDIPLSNGVLRVDRVKTAGEKNIRLGHYALPEKNDGIKESLIEVGSIRATQIDNGEFQLLAVPVSGWDNLITVHNTDVHPQSKKSTVINLEANMQDEKIFITLLLFKKSGEVWNEEDLDVIEKIEINGQQVQLQLKTVRYLIGNGNDENELQKCGHHIV